MKYCTQMEAAKKGLITEEMKQVAIEEEVDIKKMLKLAIDPEKAKKYREESKPKDEKVCTMCGDLCALKRSREVIEG